MRRRVLLSLVACFAVVALLLALLPFWLGLALRLTPEKWGVRYGAYERIGYGRFALRDLEFERATVRVKVARAEADTPLLFLWRQQSRGQGVVAIGRWSVEVRTPTASQTPRAAANAERGWMPLRARLRRIATQLDRWLPDAQAGQGSVRWPGGELTLVSATWGGRALKVKSFAYKALKADLVGAFPAEVDEVKIDAVLDGTKDGVRLSNRGADFAGEVVWWDQRALLDGKFGAAGWLPAEATLRAESLNLPATRLKLGALYSNVTGRSHVEWRGQTFRIDVQASGEPLAGKKAPPLAVDLRGRGDLQTLVLEALRVTLPGIDARLSDAVTIERNGRLREGTAVFSLDADLARQPWFAAQGIVKGEARLATIAGAIPEANFRLSATDVAAQGIAFRAVETTGKFAWPRVMMEQSTLVGGEGERLQARGGWDFQTKEVLAATVEGTLRRATLERWLPAQPDFATIALRAEGAGPVAELKHAGEAQVANITFGAVKPAALALRWSGRGAVLDTLVLGATAGETRLAANGRLNRDGLQLDGLEISQQGVSRLRLTQPATVRWRPALQISSLQLAGPEGRVDAELTWGAAGNAQIAVQRFSSAWLSDLVRLPGPAWELTSVALTGSWDRGPMTFSAVAGAAFALGGGRRATVHLSGRGDKDGIRLEALRAAEGAESIVHATGTLPIVLSPGAKPIVAIARDAPLTLDAATAPNAAFWQELAALTGFELKAPRVAAQVKGTWRKPEGNVTLQAERIAFDPKRFPRPLPSVEAIDVALVGTGDAVRLERFALQIEGQTVQASGRLPVGEADWGKVFKEPLAFARRGADLRLQIPDADLSAFSRVLPAMLAPKGRLQLDVTYRGGALNGNLRLADAATRPLGPLGVLQEIEADIALAGQSVELRSVKARSGGEAVQLTGRVELPALNLAAESSPEARAPKFDVVLKGENLPFVRRTGLLVRGDLDLHLSTVERGAERVTGTVRLRDSLFLQDVRALLPGGAASKSRRPPYFAVENPPLDAWRLDINVEGEQFMRLKTTLFNGVASARFNLGGTLGEPMALGDVMIDEGRVRLPFAVFDVQEGRVTLSREQPYEPQIWLVATAQRFGYDLRMEISGAASAPVFAFTSSPPLEHGQVLLMVMAGEAPKQEVTYTDQDRAAKLGAFLGQSLLASLSDSENADRLTITAGGKVTREGGRETYDVEYRLNNRWSLTGEIDEFDEKNVGVKWRVYSREGQNEKQRPREEAKPTNAARP